MTGPGICSSTLAMYAESLAMPRSGFDGAVTCTPLAWRRSITPFQLDASANAPCTSTTLGCASIAVTSDIGRLPSGFQSWEVRAALEIARRRCGSARRPERGAHLLREGLRLLPGRKVPAFVHPIEVDE